MNLGPFRRPGRDSVWLAGLLLVAGVTWWFAGQVKSPGQKAAEAKAPIPSPITVPVENRMLRQVVVLRGTVRPGREVKIAPRVSSENQPLVTKMPHKAGDKIGSGTWLIEIAGRPLFVFPGKVPMYRDLRPGDKGDDVAQLQNGLRSLGYSIADRTSVFGAGTAAAIGRFYRSRGYEPTMETAGQQAPQGNTGSYPSPQGDAGSSGPSTQENAGASSKPKPLLKSGEIVFVSGLPARISATSVSVGDQVNGEIMRLTSGKPYIEAPLEPGATDRVRPGLSAEADFDGITLKARVRSIRAVKQNGGGQPDGGPSGGGIGTDGGSGEATGGEPSVTKKIAIVQTSKRIAARWLGQDVVVRVVTMGSARKVITVPSAAVWTRADGTSFVVVQTSDGKTHEVPVKVGRSADGYLELIEARGLNIGDLVLLSGEQR